MCVDVPVCANMPVCVDVPVCCPLSCSTVRSPAGKVTASSQGKQLQEWCEFIRTSVLSHRNCN